MSETHLEFNDDQGRRVIRIDKDPFTMGGEPSREPGLVEARVARLPHRAYRAFCRFLRRTSVP